MSENCYFLELGDMTQDIQLHILYNDIWQVIKMIYYFSVDTNWHSFDLLI